MLVSGLAWALPLAEKQHQRLMWCQATHEQQQRSSLRAACASPARTGLCLTSNPSRSEPQLWGFPQPHLQPPAETAHPRLTSCTRSAPAHRPRLLHLGPEKIPEPDKSRSLHLLENLRKQPSFFSLARLRCQMLYNEPRTTHVLKRRTS